MGALPLSTPEMVPSPLSGDEAATLEHESATRAEELRILKRKLNGASIFTAGPANVVMQLGWPEVGRGVVESPVRSGQVTRHPFKRFRTTIGYIGIALFGSDEQRESYRQAVNGAHRQVRSGPDSPVKYNAFNRDLQLWVASCIYYGLWDTAVRCYGPMPADEEALLLRACSRLGTTLQLPEDMWHRSPEEFWAYWEAGLDRVSMDDEVAAYLTSLMQIEILPYGLDRIVGRPLGWLNSGFLPAPIRDELGLDWTADDQRRHDRIMRVIGLVTRPLPSVLRLFPMNAMALNIEARRRLGLKQV